MKITTDADGLVWHCDTCTFPIAPGAGYVGVAVNEADNEPDAKSITLGELLALPDEGDWYAHHDTCDPTPDVPGYVIGTERLTTHAEVLDRTADLLGKPWIGDTNWDEVLRCVSGAFPGAPTTTTNGAPA